MPAFRVRDDACVLCRTIVERQHSTDANALVFSTKTGLTPLPECEIVCAAEEWFMVHQDCLQVTKTLLAKKIGPDTSQGILRCLNELNESNRYSWPVPQSVRDARARRTAANAFRNVVQTTRTPVLPQSLPAELLFYIGELSYPSEATRLSLLRKTAVKMASLRGQTRSPRRLANHGRKLEPIFRESVCSTYVVDLVEGPSPRDSSNALVVCRDDVACTSVRYECHERQSASHGGSWYRKLSHDSQAELILYYKVIQDNLRISWDRFNLL